MVNPDGVVIGNYRTNLSGNDVNRRWDFPNKLLHPEIVAIKKKMAEDKRDVRMFLDLHAHSRKYTLVRNQDELAVLRVALQLACAQAVPVHLFSVEQGHQLRRLVLQLRPFQALNGSFGRADLTRHPQMLHFRDIFLW